MVVGIDEVGRGALAGPLCIAAVAIGAEEFEGLSDSKKVAKSKRPLLAQQIKRRAQKVGIGWVSARQIDQIGMGPALKLAARRAFAQIDDETITQIIIDGTILLIDDPRATTMKQADLLVPCVSAASIIAKVARDDYMLALAQLFPKYGFEGHVGYGTSTHLSAIRTHGASPVHRQSFAPMSQKSASAKKPMASVLTDGQIAEQRAAAYLEEHGYTVIDANWKTKWCEIDLVARKGDTVFLVEVKYRRTNRFGNGIDAITPKKLRQMRFAAQLWQTIHAGQAIQLAALSVTGDDFEVEDVIVIND